MNANITPQPPETLQPATAPLPVSIVCASAHDGRVPVAVTVVPVADLEVTGVFVDYRKQSMGADAGAVAESLSATPVEGERVSTLKLGDAAVAALVAREAASEAATVRRSSDAPTEFDEQTRQAQAMADSDGANAPSVSYQIAPGLRLTVGQAETFRVDVALPEAPAAGEVWLARGRFAAKIGHDLSSAWTPIT